MRKLQILNVFLLPSLAFAHGGAVSSLPPGALPVMADIPLLKAAGIALKASDSGLNVGVGLATPAQRVLISQAAHKAGRCGGYELLEAPAFGLKTATAPRWDDFIQPLRREAKRAQASAFAPFAAGEGIMKRESIAQAVEQADAQRLQDFVTWYSSFETRFNHDETMSMTAVRALKERLEKLVGDKATVEFVEHTRTPQNSIRVRFTGTERPDEIVVLGAHLDSVNWEDSNGGRGKAPGADDNGSGTGNMFETVRTLATQPAPQRTIEVFFYAAEESGLVGSREIAEEYANAKKQVVSVLQLDMTLMPGTGEGTMGLIRDYTDPWLTTRLQDLNRLYVGAKMIDDKCGYGCSDHASWHRQGFPAAIPFESTMNSMNDEIHTPRDTINSRSSFTHSNLFTRLAIAYALEFGNSTLARPEDQKIFMMPSIKAR